MEAPVIYIPEQVREPNDAFEVLWNHLPWEHRGAPRKECWMNPYGQPYTYGSGEHARTYTAHPLMLEEEPQAISLVWAIMYIMNKQLGYEFDCCFANGYDHGRQHLGWHADDSPEMDENHAIATVSLGAEREIWFRHVGSETVEKLLLGHGSAAIMAAGMQTDWQHRIPKSPKVDCGPRLSLTYRKLVRNG